MVRRTGLIAGMVSSLLIGMVVVAGENTKGAKPRAEGKSLRAGEIDALIAKHKDEGETQADRFEVLISLCASGDDKAVQYVKEIWQRDQKWYPARVISHLNMKRLEGPGDLDRDGDGLSNYVEQGLMLDPDNPDTDGDGIRDNEDRNPMTPMVKELSETQKAARAVFWAYTKSVDFSHGMVPASTASPWVYLLKATNEHWSSAGEPSLAAGIEFTGFNGVALRLDQNQLRQYRRLHTCPIARSVFLVCIDEMQNKNARQSMMDYAKPEPGEKLFWISHEDGNLSSWLVRMRRCDGVWLPVSWQDHWETD